MDQAHGPSMYDAPPPYNANVSGPPANLPTEEGIPQLESEEDSESMPSEAPPAFSSSPITLALLPNATLIKSTMHNKRAFYELTRPLNGHARTLFLAEIPPSARLREDGHLLEIEKRHKLYKIYEAMQLPRNPNHTAVSGQKKKLVQGTILRRSPKGNNWEASSHGEDGTGKGELIYAAKEKKGVLQWKDPKGTLVAIEHMAVNRVTEEERLEILVPLDKKLLDILVAVWVARIHQDTQKEGEKEEQAEKKKRKEEQKAKDIEAGKPHGLLHNMKEKLGIGYGVKPGPQGGGFGGPPTLRDDGRIKWS